MSELANVLEEIAARGETRGAASVVSDALEAFEDNTTVLVPAAPRRRVKRVALVTAAAVLALIVAIRVLPDQPNRVNAADNADAQSVNTVLVVGVDRSPAGPGLPASVRPYDLLLMRLSRSTGAAASLSVPGDIVSSGRRLSEIRTDGPDALRAAVQHVTGVSISNYIELDADAFAELIDSFGGVRLRVGAPMRDPVTGLSLESGCVNLDGATASKYVRSSHVMSLENGKWSADPTIELGRIQREQALLAAARRQSATWASDSGRRELALDTLVGSASGDADAKAAAAMLVVDWLQAPRVPRTLLLPVVTARMGDAAVYEVDETEAASVMRLFDTDEPEPPSVETADCS